MGEKLKANDAHDVQQQDAVSIESKEKERLHKEQETAGRVAESHVELESRIDLASDVEVDNKETAFSKIRDKMPEDLQRKAREVAHNVSLGMAKEYFDDEDKTASPDIVDYSFIMMPDISQKDLVEMVVDESVLPVSKEANEYDSAVEQTLEKVKFASDQLREYSDSLAACQDVIAGIYMACEGDAQKVEQIISSEDFAEYFKVATREESNHVPDDSQKDSDYSLNITWMASNIIATHEHHQTTKEGRQGQSFKYDSLNGNENLSRWYRIDDISAQAAQYMKEQGCDLGSEFDSKVEETQDVVDARNAQLELMAKMPDDLRDFADAWANRTLDSDIASHRELEQGEEFFDRESLLVRERDAAYRRDIAIGLFAATQGDSSKAKDVLSRADIDQQIQTAIEDKRRYDQSTTMIIGSETNSDVDSRTKESIEIAARLLNPGLLGGNNLSPIISDVSIQTFNDLNINGVVQDGVNFARRNEMLKGPNLVETLPITNEGDSVNDGFEPAAEAQPEQDELGDEPYTDQLVITDVDRNASIDRQAHDLARRQLMTELKEARGIKGRIANMWKGNIFRGYYERRYQNEIRQKLLEENDDISRRLLDESDVDARRHAAAIAMERMQKDSDDFINESAGESRRELAEDDPARLEMIGIMREFILNDDFGEEAFQESMARARGLADGQLNGHIDNALAVAMLVKGKLEHDLSSEEAAKQVDKMLNGAKFYEAESREGVRTAEHRTLTDRVVEKFEHSRFGRLVPTEIVAGAAGVAVWATAAAARNRALAYASFGGSLAATATIAALREGNMTATDRQILARAMAEGGSDKVVNVIDGEMGAVMLNMTSAESLRSESQNVLEMEAGDPNRLNSMRDVLSNLIIHQEMSDRNDIDLISYSSANAVESERMGLLNQRLALQAAFIKAMKEENPDFDYGRDFKEPLLNAMEISGDRYGIMDLPDELSEKTRDLLRNIDGDRQQKDKAYKKLRRHRMRRSALVATTISGSASLAMYGVDLFMRGDNSIFSFMRHDGAVEASPGLTNNINAMSGHYNADELSNGTIDELRAQGYDVTPRTGMVESVHTTTLSAEDAVQANEHFSRSGWYGPASPNSQNLFYDKGGGSYGYNISGGVSGGGETVSYDQLVERASNGSIKMMVSPTESTQMNPFVVEGHIENGQLVFNAEPGSPVSEMLANHTYRFAEIVDTSNNMVMSTVEGSGTATSLISEVHASSEQIIGYDVTPSAEMLAQQAAEKSAEAAGEAHRELLPPMPLPLYSLRSRRILKLARLEHPASAPTAPEMEESVRESQPEEIIVEAPSTETSESEIVSNSSDNIITAADVPSPNAPESEVTNEMREEVISETPLSNVTETDTAEDLSEDLITADDVPSSDIASPETSDNSPEDIITASDVPRPNSNESIESNEEVPDRSQFVEAVESAQAEIGEKFDIPRESFSMTYLSSARKAANSVNKAIREMMRTDPGLTEQLIRDSGLEHLFDIDREGKIRFKDIPENRKALFGGADYYFMREKLNEALTTAESEGRQTNMAYELMRYLAQYASR